MLPVPIKGLVSNVQNTTFQGRPGALGPQGEPGPEGKGLLGPKVMSFFFHQDPLWWFIFS